MFQEHSQGSLVFFDFLGLFTIHYPELARILLNFAVILASVAITWSKDAKAYQYGSIFLQIKFCSCLLPSETDS